MLSDDQWELIEPLVPRSDGRRGRPYRYQAGIAWRDLPERFGPWQTVSNPHRRFSGDGTWDAILTLLLAEADAAGLIDWEVSVDSTVNRAHQHATNLPRDTGGSVELHEFARGAA